jgi:MFS superfamily sulfate permease-like transporter
MGVARRRWSPPLFGSFKGWTKDYPGRDILAGLTLAAITVPEQMATAKLGGFEPQIGFYAFIGATVGFAALGASRVLTAGADSTITPIFAGTLASLAAGGSTSIGSVATTLAFLVVVGFTLSFYRWLHIRRAGRLYWALGKLKSARYSESRNPTTEPDESSKLK